MFLKHFSSRNLIDLFKKLSLLNILIKSQMDWPENSNGCWVSATFYSSKWWYLTILLAVFWSGINNMHSNHSYSNQCNNNPRLLWQTCPNLKEKVLQLGALINGVHCLWWPRHEDLHSERWDSLCYVLEFSPW